MNFFKSRNWYKFSKNPLSVLGLLIVTLIIVMAVFANYLTPYPEHAGPFVDIPNKIKPPSSTYFFGTDKIGRDTFSRIIFGYRTSLILGVIVLCIAVPIGTSLGLVAGYFGGKIDAIIMRITDIFLSIPPLVLALSIMAFLKPTLTNAMIAVSMMWWPWYTRLIYNLTRSIKNEGFVISSRIVGASHFHIIFREILPNCSASLITKITLDMGFVILIGSSLSFLGLGVQPPTPDLGTMVSQGSKYLPDIWWLSVFPGLAILVIVLGFNLLGDGLKDLFDVEL
jgi:peptide/nickel transport system permease protein